MSTTETEVKEAIKVADKPKSKRKPKTAAKSKRNRKVLSHKRIAKRTAMERKLEELARILIESSDADITKSDLAERLLLNHGTVYRWAGGESISPCAAFTIIVKMKHRIAKIANKRTKKQAAELLAAVSEYMEDKP